MIRKLTALIRFLFEKQFVRYIFVGGVATVVDWGTFYILNVLLRTHYQVSLVIAWLLGVLVHYTLNRLFAFRSKAKQVFKQIATHITISILSLGMSSLFMYILVELVSLFPMYARILITAIMIIFNYFMHRLFTFNEKWVQ
jgi:putative flippase GtrA